MRNVLIIAPLYGSKRTLSLAKYLPEFGWNPTIITPPIHWQPTIITPDDRKIPDLPFTVIVTDYRDTNSFLKKLLGTDTTESAKSKARELLHATSQHSWVNRLFNLGGMFLNYPDSHKGWEQYALDASNDYLTKYKVDALLSICPIMSHIVASRLKKEHDILWVADFPDLWSQNFNYSYGSLRRLVDRRLEKKTMSSVDILTSSSALCAERLGELHTGKPAYSITLGYDPQDYDTCPSAPTKKFTITYTGLIYEGKQSPGKLLTALYELLNTKQIDRDDCDVRFYGKYLSWLDDEIKALCLSDIVQQYDTVPHSTIVGIQRKSQILLLLDWDDPTELGAYTAKVFEYLGARRPILAVGGVHGNAVSDLLKETDAGIHAPSVDEIRVALVKYYTEYKNNGSVSYAGKEPEIEKHSQRAMAGKFAGLLSGESNR